MTTKFVQDYWDGHKKHKNYAKALDVFWHMDFHASGYFKKPWVSTNQPKKNRNYRINPYFKLLIDERRPSESNTILKYRRSVYKPVTQTPFYAVVNSLQKIFRSDEFTTSWVNTEVPKFLTEENTLQDYCTINYPYWDSIDNWASKQLLRWSLVDPNALCVIFPLNYDKEENELYNPYAHIIESQDVLDYVENQMCVFISPYKSKYMTEDGEQEGKILCFCDQNEIWEARQINDNEDFVIELRMEHNIGSLPAFLLGGENVGSDAITPFYESFLKGMLPYLDEMAGDSSDLSAEKIQHLFSEKWYIQPQVCSTCAGSGFSGAIAGGKQAVCPTCEGNGVAPKSPYRDWVINPSNAIGQSVQIPTPPAGYLEKDTKIIELMMQIIKDHSFNALAAVHMQFLFSSPLDQSGIAKAYDGQETNNFVSKIAEQLIQVDIEQVYYYINEMRYMGIVPDPEAREDMLPLITVPHSFDLITEQALEQNMLTLNTAEVSETIKKQMEMRYLNFKYPESKIADKLQLMQDHDPFEDENIDEKIALLNSDAVEKVDVVLSLYLGSFLTEILAKDEDFINKEYQVQHDLLIQMAEDKVDNISDAMEAALIPMFDAEGNPLQPQPSTTAQKRKNQKLSKGNVPAKKEKSGLGNA